ncbi:alpha/beta hydrolase [Neobacillus cucumis]|nr:alpha/beta hydrolase [Neobacillus cucumis]
MKSFFIKGGSGTSLFVVEGGNPYGKPILFVHDVSQNHLSWIHQFQSKELEQFRLIALDLRGHGFSEKPKEGYHNQQNWADDIQSVIHALNLKKPLLVGWSYGGKVVLDYLQIYGEGDISGINLVNVGTSSGISGSGGTYYTPALQAVIPGLISKKALESTNALKQFVTLLFAQNPTLNDFYFILGYNTMVPPYVREAIITRSESYDDLLPTIQKPVLLTHGVKDKIIYPAQSIENAQIIPNSILSLYAYAGHSPFWESVEKYNQDLSAFANGRNM